MPARNRERPIIGDRRPPSRLGDIQPDHWLAEYTTELLDVLHVREPSTQAHNHIQLEMSWFGG